MLFGLTDPFGFAEVGYKRLLERVGFHREGVARAAHVLPVSRERIDCVMWSLLPGDAGPDQPPA